MKLYIARHYWKDNLKATWKYHEKIDDKLFNYLKVNYPKFEREEPSFIQYNKKFIYLFYKKEIEKEANREITNIDFFISLEKISKNILNNQEFFQNIPDSLEVSIRTKKEYLMGAIVLVLLFSLYHVGVSSLNNLNSEINKTDNSAVFFRS